MILRLSFSLLPVLAFLAMLTWLDSYKLVRFSLIVKTIFFGMLIAVPAYIINTQLGKIINEELLSGFFAPISEEILKAIFPLLLIKKNKIGFVADAAIIGFAVGTGFALIENIYYALSLTDASIMVWVFRGLGTAIMHGGNTALFAMLFIYLQEKHPQRTMLTINMSILPVFAIHSFFNHFFLPPIINIILQILLLPILMMFVFERSEKGLKEWLQVGFDTDVKVLSYLKSGQFSQTKQGQYLLRFKQRFAPEILFDLFCYLRIYLELSIRSKGILMLKETGMEIEIEEEIQDKFKELQFLEESIGKQGIVTIQPLLNISKRELWQIYFLEKQ